MRHLVKPLAYQMSNLGLGLATGIIAARFLGAEQRGQLAIFVAASFMLSTVIGACSHESLPYLIRSQRPPSRVIGTAVVIQVALGSSAGLLSLLIPLVLLVPGPAVLQLQPWFAAACVAYATNHAISTGVLARSGATGYVRIETIRHSAYLVFLTVFVVVLSRGLPGAVLAFLAALAIQLSAAMITLRRTTRDLRWDRSLAREEIDFGARALPGRVAEYLFAGGGDVLVMSLAMSPIGIGYYVVARAVIDLTLLPAVSTGLLVQGPSITSRYGPTRTKHFLVASAALTLSAAAILALAGPTLIEIVFGTAFAPAGALLSWLLPAVPAFLIIRVVTAWNTREGFPHRNSIAVGSGAVVLVVIVPIAGQFLGTNAAVAALSLAVWFQCGMLLLLHRRADR